MTFDECSLGDSEQWSAYIDGTLTEIERADAISHLASCTKCRAIVARLERIVAAASSATLTPPPSVRAAILGKLTERPPVNTASTGSVRRSLHVSLAAASTLLAASILAAVLIGRRSSPPSESAQPSFSVDVTATASLRRTLSTLDAAIAAADVELARHPEDRLLAQFAQDARSDKARALEAARAVMERSR